MEKPVPVAEQEPKPKINMEDIKTKMGDKAQELITSSTAPVESPPNNQEPPKSLIVRILGPTGKTTASPMLPQAIKASGAHTRAEAKAVGRMLLQRTKIVTLVRD